MNHFTALPEISIVKTTFGKCEVLDRSNITLLYKGNVYSRNVNNSLNTPIEICLMQSNLQDASCNIKRS